MNTETLVGSPVGKMFARILAAGMESRFRYRFFGPTNILLGVDGLQGQKVLEIGCGTGFFTIPAAGMIGEEGSLVSMDIVPESVDMVAKKVQTAEKRRLKADLYVTSTRSQRHLTKPLRRYGMEKHGADVRSMIREWHSA